MTGDEFKARVQRVYTKHTGKEGSYGAHEWFGGWCRRTGRAVYEWTAMPAVPDGPHLVTLALLEVCPKGSRTLTAVQQEIRSWLHH